MTHPGVFELVTIHNEEHRGFLDIVELARDGTLQTGWQSLLCHTSRLLNARLCSEGFWDE